MWIKVNTQDGPHFSIPIPLFLAGTRPVINMLTKINGPENCWYAPMAGEIVRELRRYVRKHGHFTLVEVISSEGDHIKITV
ncbi:MAG: hypothetical protein II918_04320 [Firmicutes bacterium]|nr:hypothetical protein [Bacillota bacterium]